MNAFSRHLRRPTALAHHVIRPALAATGEVLATGMTWTPEIGPA
jgi:hypothetical protein